MEDKNIRSLRASVRKLQRENLALKRKVKSLERIAKRYRRSPYDFFFRALKKTVKTILPSLFYYPSITVIIPTYQRNDLFQASVDSVLQQKYKKRQLHVIVVHNGRDAAYFDYLNSKFQSMQRVSVIHTDEAGCAMAREYAKKYIRTKWMFFLDDDDYLTPGYFKELVGCIRSKRVKIVCGKVVDVYKSGAMQEDTYINRSLKKAGNGIVDPYGPISSAFALATGKLYETTMFKHDFVPFNIALQHTEDVDFWVNNLDRIPRGSVWSCANAKEAYVRRVRPGSISRPSKEAEFKFMCNDQVASIERYEKRLLDKNVGTKQKNFILNIIWIINKRMQKYYNALDDEGRNAFRKIAYQSNSGFVNRSFFGEKKGIAFCHNFSPAIDASAFVASKRLSQIADYFHCRGIDWTVISADMSWVRNSDNVWNTYYARFQYTRKRVVGVDTNSLITVQDKWGNDAYYQIRDKHADYVYSRSMWIGSHIAASRYKKSHKNVVWIAEFSDPVVMGTDNTPKKLDQNYTGEMEIFNDYYHYVEQLVYEGADKIIFTNDNQKQYMLAYSGNLHNEEVLKKSLVWNHPLISSDYAKLFSHDIPIDKNKINIAYFGIFYKNRGADELLKFLKNESIVVHLFTRRTEEIESLSFQYPNLAVYDFVPLLKMYSIIPDMDYCFVNDLAFPGELNPYLPSKISDYLSAGGFVIALVIGNSPMRHYQHDHLIKTECIDDDFVYSLTKRRS